MTTGCENCDFMDMRHQPDRVLEATTTTFEGTCANIDPDNSWVARWIGCAGFVPGLYVSPRPPHHDSHVLLSLSYIYCVLVNLETALRRRMASAATERAIERERERKKNLAWRCQHTTTSSTTSLCVLTYPFMFMITTTTTTYRYAINVQPPMDISEELSEILERNGIDLKET